MKQKWPVFLILLLGIVIVQFRHNGFAAPASHRVPAGVLPVLGCWFWQEPEFAPDGFRDFIDLVSVHAPYNLLTTSLRIPEKEVTDDDVVAQIDAAARYAEERGVPLVMDLDVRLARRAFAEAYPDELQEMLRLQEVELDAGGDIEVEVSSRDLNDHYTHRTTHYIPLHGSLQRVYSYVRDSDGIDPATLKDITASCTVTASSERAVKVRVPHSEEAEGQRACVMVSFAHLTPAVFAPHLMEFQRGILQRYADVPLAGVCKDEWGFPPCFDGDPDKNEYWYSRHRARAYAERTGGRELVADCLLMHVNILGRERERLAAINHFMMMSYKRNAALEDDFYRAVKDVFGDSAVAATHPTWWPYPDSREFKKNGLSWWAATRDWAQTDETTPFAVRTALAKKWGSPVWYNMYYSTSKTDYERNVWAYALAGGRINYHPPWPEPKSLLERRRTLLRGGLMRAESRVRLLNFITRAPLDCPVAVVFGHASAMNWAGPGYNDVGMEVADRLWSTGYPADLIPTSEIENGSLRIGEDGSIQYGPQRYAAVVLYHPNLESMNTLEFFQEAAKGPTSLFRVGGLTNDFAGNRFGDSVKLPDSMAVESDFQVLVLGIGRALRAKGVPLQTPATVEMGGFGHTSASPGPGGSCRLTDGTIIWVAGSHDVQGDRLQKTTTIHGRSVSIDATGVAAVRLDENGEIEAFAAGGLRRIFAGSLELTLDRAADVAMWRDDKGRFRGVLQGHEGPVPDALESITSDWVRLAVPVGLGSVD